MNLKEFFKECIKKEVFKKLSLYIVSSWVLIQVFSEIWEPIGLPKISMTYLLLILLIGFPLNIYLLWKYRLKPKEYKIIRRDALRISTESDDTKEDTRRIKKKKFHLLGIHFYSPFQKMYFTSLYLITFITIFTAALIVKANFIKEENMTVFTFSEEPDNNRIAVLPFKNNTLDTNLDVVGKMAVDWIMHGITQNKAGEVISPQIVEDYTNVLKSSFITNGENGVLKEYLKPSKVVTGTYYLNKGRLGYLLSKEKVVIGIEETPPNFKAYKLWLESDALSRMQAPKQLDFINEAIAADSSFFKPKLDRVAYYYNRDQFEIADSLLQRLKDETGTKKQQRNMINHYEACFRGDNKMAYKTYKEEYRIAPTDLEISLSYMVLALQFVNRPQDVDSIYLATDMKDFDLEACVSCEYRYFVKGMANLEMGLVKETIELLAPYARTAGQEWVKEVLMIAYVKNGNHQETNELLEHIRLLGRIEYWGVMMLKTGLEYVKIGKDIEANQYFNQVSDYLNEKTDKLTTGEQELLAEIIFYQKDFAKAQELLEPLLTEGNDNISNMAYLAMSYYKNGKEEKAQKTIDKLIKLRTKYQFGDIDYALAQYYAFSEKEEKSLDHLLKAVAAGKRFMSTTFQNDPLFKPYIELEAFQKILKFWYD